jgi:DNA-binding CsgD family transcriptional regulator
MVGRERELTELVDRFQAASNGGSITLIAGEPGIGKSRLLAELRALAQESGALVLRGGATEAAGMPPYLPFIEAIGDFCREAETSSLRDLAGADAEILATLLPGLAERLGVIPASDHLPIDQARLRLFEAVTSLLDHLARRRPTLVVFDDLQWADPATLDLLAHLVRRSAGSPLAFAGAYREGEVDANPALVRALAELTRLRALSVVPARRLDRDAIASLASNAVGNSVPPAVADELFRQSEGNPFFAEELLQAWLMAGSLVHIEGRWVLQTPAARARTIIEAIQLRLSALPAATVDLLKSASIIGRTFEIELLAEAAGIDAEEAEELLLPAARFDIVRGDDDRGYTFSHDKIRECLYADVTSTRRKRLHGFIGRAMELRGESASGQSLVALAFHFGRSGDRQRGGEYASAAMRAALAGYAPEDAIAHGLTARALLPESDATRGELLVRLAESLTLGGRLDDAVECYGEAALWFAARDELEHAAAALHGQGNALWRLESIPDARAAFERALTIAGDAPSATRIRLLNDLGSLVATSQLRTEEGIALANQAIALASESGERVLEAAVRRNLGNLYVRSNRMGQGLPLLEQALGLAIELDDAVEAAECCACLLTAHYWLGNSTGMEEAGLRQIGFAERSRDLFQLRHVFGWLASIALATGDPERSDLLLAKQAEIVERLGAPEPIALLDSQRGMLLLWRGDLEGAEVALQRSLDRYRELNPAALVWHEGRLAEVLYLRGRVEEAAAIRGRVEQALEGCPPDSPVIPEALTSLVPMAIAERDQTRIASYRARLRPFSGRMANNIIDRTLGMLALAAGDHREAERLLTRAERQSRECHLGYELALTLRAKAELVLARDGKPAAAQARRLHDEANALLDRIRIGAATGSKPVAASRRLPAGLSEREGEVLRLLASGLSNREIAEALFISEKTVANHLTSIFAKTGTDNRVAAATFAIRHGIANESDG